VQHGVAVWTDWDQILFRVEVVRTPRRSQRLLVMNVNEAPTDGAVSLLKVKPAAGTLRPVLSQAGATCTGIPLVMIDNHATDRTLLVGGSVRQSLRKVCLRRNATTDCILRKRTQPTSRLCKLFRREERSKPLVENKRFNGKIRAAGINQSLQPFCTKSPLRLRSIRLAASRPPFLRTDRRK
jgi:hypothetical protein